MIKQTTKSKLIAIVFTILALIFSNDIFTNASNPPSNATNAPGEGNCTSCHTGTAISSGTAWSSINMSGLPATYVPGTNYALTLNGSSAATVKNGFELTVLNSSNNSTGTLTAGTGSSTATSTRVYLKQTTSSVSSWSFNWTAPVAGTGTVTFYVAFNGSNNNNSDGSGDNIYVKTFTLSEQPSNLPTATITASTTATCIGDTVTLTGSGINSPTGFSWVMTGGTPSLASTQVTKVVYASQGQKTITLTTTNGSGTSSPNSISIFVNPKPSASITTTNTLVCGSDSVALTANAGNGYQYVWTGSTQTSRIINVAAAGNYTVKVTSPQGCATTSTAVTIKQRAKPIIDLVSTKDTICIGDSILFSAKGKATNYSFYNGPTLMRSNKDSNFYFKSQPGIYNISVVAQDSIFCSNISNSILAYINAPLPLPNVGCGNKTVTSVEYSWGSLIGATSYQVSLDSGSNWIAPSGSSGLSHVVSGLPINGLSKIWVRALDNNICGPSPVSISTCQAANCPRLPVTITADTKACVSDTGKASVTVATPNDGKVYTVSINNNPPAKPGKYTLKFGTSSGVYNVSVKVIDSSNLVCSFDTLLQITNYDAPSGNVQISSSHPNGIYCHYDSIINLKVRKLVGVDSIIFAKLDLQTLIQTQLKSSASDTILITNTNILNAGNNMITVREKNNLSGCYKSSAILITKVDKIQRGFTHSVSNPFGNVLFTDTTLKAIGTHVWDFGDGSKDSVSLNPTHQYLSNGVFVVSLIDKELHGCYDTAWKAITISKVGVSEFTKSEINIYPIPAHNTLHIDLSNSTKGVYTITDMLGKTVLTNTFTSNSFDILLDGISKGYYFINIHTEEETLVRKLMLE